MASRLRKILEKLLFSLFHQSLQGVASSSLKLSWKEVLHALDGTSVVILGNEHDVCGSHQKPISLSSNELLLDSANVENPLSPNSPKFSACQSLLRFLSRFPRGCLSAKSLALYTKLILNIER